MSKPITDIRNRIKDALNIRNMSQQELCDKTGIPKSSLSQYISGYAKPKQDRVCLMSSALNVEPAWLLGYNVPMDPVTPLYEAAAGQGRITENYTSDIAPLHLNADEVAVTVKGDSMSPLLCDGDIAIVAATSVVVSESDIMLVKINGNEATLKYVKKDSDGLYLYAENTDVYKRKFFTAKEVEELPITIEGIVVRFIRELK